MLCAARRGNVCEPAALILGLLSLVHIISASELLKCEESFYRNISPQLVTESGLERRCHSLGAGRNFVSLYHPGHQSNVYTALHLGQHNVWGKGTNEELDKPSKTDDLEELHVPALYKKDRGVDLSESASPFHKLDAHTAELVESRTVPQCSKAGGSVYVQSGLGGPSETKADVLWSAVCCDVPDGQSSFSFGMIQEGEGELKLMSVKELEELLSVKELFSGRCGETGRLEEYAPENTEVSDENTDMAKTDKSAEEDEVTDRTADRVESEPRTEESANETESSDSQEDSVIVYVLSSVIYLLYAPVSPVVSTLTNLPSQICYVLQEDAAVLASLPSDSFSLVQNLGSGMVSGVENVGSVAYQVGEHGVCSLYTFISTLAGTLVLSCQEGLVGTGTLMGDVLGLVIGALGELWDFGTEVIVCMCQRVGGYVGAVGSEMGEQGLSIGEGIGNLAWRGQRGLGHVINTVVGIVGGVLGNTLENIQEAFSKE
ncbi:endonuclease domain-containing 1 protein [Tachysurus ichikawai]